MASINKLKKLKNSYCIAGELKNKFSRLKRIAFFTASQRRHINKIKTHEIE